MGGRVLPEMSAADLVALLRRLLASLHDLFLDVRSGDVDYIQMRASREWGLFMAASAELGDEGLREELCSMSENERKAMLINLYNAMTFHGIVSYGRRPGAWYLYCFFITPAVSYRVAGVPVSLDDVEHGMLRARRGYFKAEDQELQRKLRMEHCDPRIHMALNCGARGCPPVHVYMAETLDADLDAATASFVASDQNVCITGNEVALTELFKMYIVDFAGPDAKAGNPQSFRKVLEWILPFTSGSKRDQLASLIGGELKPKWSPYDWDTNGPDMPIDSRIYSFRL